MDKFQHFDIKIYLLPISIVACFVLLPIEVIPITVLIQITILSACRYIIVDKDSTLISKSILHNITRSNDIRIKLKDVSQFVVRDYFRGNSEVYFILNSNNDTQSMWMRTGQKNCLQAYLEKQYPSIIVKDLHNRPLIDVKKKIGLTHKKNSKKSPFLSKKMSNDLLRCPYCDKRMRDYWMFSTSPFVDDPPICIECGKEGKPNWKVWIFFFLSWAGWFLISGWVLSLVLTTEESFSTQVITSAVVGLPPFFIDRIPIGIFKKLRFFDKKD